MLKYWYCDAAMTAASSVEAAAAVAGALAEKSWKQVNTELDKIAFVYCEPSTQA